VLDERMADLDDERRQAIIDDQRRESLESELRVLHEHLGSAETQRETVLLEHLPTPMAKTVFTREMHVQLRDGRVTVIPWERLVESLKQQVPLAARRNSSRDVLEDTLGPVGGFLMKYRMIAIP